MQTGIGLRLRHSVPLLGCTYVAPVRRRVARATSSTEPLKKSKMFQILFTPPALE
jgi:hypothetical protein